jgi:hypothetical protein
MALSKKRIGTKGSAQDNFLEPLNVTGLSATDVGTSRPYSTTFNGTSGQGGAASLSWTLPEASPPATNYDITATRISDNQTVTVNYAGAGTSFTFEGLESNVSYNFTVIPKNNAGTAKSPNTVSDSVTATTVPQAPQSVSVSTGAAGPSPTPSSGYDRITWSAGVNGGKAISSYRVASSVRGTLSSSASSPYDTLDPTLPDSSADESYTVYASNANGESLGGTTSPIQTFTPPHFPPFFPPFFPPHFPPFFPPFFPPYFPPFFPPHFPPHFPPFFPPHFPPFFPPHFPPHFPPFFPPHFPPFFPPHFPPHFPPFFPPHFPPFFPPHFPPHFPPFFPPHFPPFFPPFFGCLPIGTSAGCACNGGWWLSSRCTF